jgi:hypothetical protein
VDGGRQSSIVARGILVHIRQGSQQLGCITCPHASWVEGTTHRASAARPLEPLGSLGAGDGWLRASGAQEPSGDAPVLEGARSTTIPVAANGAVQVTCLAAVAACFFFLLALLQLVGRAGVAVAAAVTSRIPSLSGA